ncbi:MULTISPECIES: hypothetical protein [Sorangium]|uniref:hypothetical protein n=1 Tax=Sorangium TaxID=39643 RepID=UPI00101A401E|nr:MULTISPECIES: hypothetical protein [Sorangium]
MACVVCTHPARRLIEEWILRGSSLRRTAKKYGLLTATGELNFKGVDHHKRVCMPKARVTPISRYEGEEDETPILRERRAPLTSKQIDLAGKSAKERLEGLLDRTVEIVNGGPEFVRLQALKEARSLVADIDALDKVEQPATQKGPDASALTASILDKLDKLHDSASQTDAEPTPLPSENAAPAVH